MLAFNSYLVHREFLSFLKKFGIVPPLCTRDGDQTKTQKNTQLTWCPHPFSLPPLDTQGQSSSSDLTCRTWYEGGERGEKRKTTKTIQFINPEKKRKKREEDKKNFTQMNLFTLLLWQLSIGGKWGEKNPTNLDSQFIDQVLWWMRGKKNHPIHSQFPPPQHIKKAGKKMQTWEISKWHSCDRRSNKTRKKRVRPTLTSCASGNR